MRQGNMALAGKRGLPLGGLCANIKELRRGGRVVEGDRLLSDYRVTNSVAGSNPALSAITRHCLFLFEI